MAKALDVEKTKQFVSSAWDDSIIPTLSEYIRIPNVSPMFDKDWATNGHVDKVVTLFVDWVKAQNVPELELEVLRLENRTPLIFITIPSSEKDFNKTVLLYGHLDKQPPLTESWKEGLGPYTPVIKDGKLYGRGGADDGYAIFAAITAIRNLKNQGVPHGRAVIIIEASEESGSPDLMPYVSHLKERIGVPDLIVCLDSGCGNYDQFWMTTSLRGLIAGNLKIEILKDGVHSGVGTGVVPSSFRKLRQLLSKIENQETGEILVPELHCEIPKERLEQAKKCAATLGDSVWNVFPWVEGGEPVSKDINELILNRTWRPTIAVTGVDGIPPLAVAGNVLRPYTTIKLSVRLPPRTSAEKAGVALKKVLEENANGCKVSFELDKSASGWNAPALADWLSASVNSASEAYFGKPPNYLGEGGSIPFMGMLGDMFPQAQFVVTGLLGPESNAHGPNEMLVIEMGKGVTSCVSQILRDHYVKFSS